MYVQYEAAVLIFSSATADCFNSFIVTLTQTWLKPSPSRQSIASEPRIVEAKGMDKLQGSVRGCVSVEWLRDTQGTFPQYGVIPSLRDGFWQGENLPCLNSAAL